MLSSTTRTTDMCDLCVSNLFSSPAMISILTEPFRCMLHSINRPKRHENHACAWGCALGYMAPILHSRLFLFVLRVDILSVGTRQDIKTFSSIYSICTAYCSELSRKELLVRCDVSFMFPDVLDHVTSVHCQMFESLFEKLLNLPLYMLRCRAARACFLDTSASALHCPALEGPSRLRCSTSHVPATL